MLLAMDLLLLEQNWYSFDFTEQCFYMLLSLSFTEKSVSRILSVSLSLFAFS